MTSTSLLFYDADDVLNDDFIDVNFSGASVARNDSDLAAQNLLWKRPANEQQPRATGSSTTAAALDTINSPLARTLAFPSASSTTGTKQNNVKAARHQREAAAESPLPATPLLEDEEWAQPNEEKWQFGAPSKTKSLAVVEHSTYDGKRAGGEGRENKEPQKHQSGGDKKGNTRVDDQFQDLARRETEVFQSTDFDEGLRDKKDINRVNKTLKPNTGNRLDDKDAILDSISFEQLSRQGGKVQNSPLPARSAHDAPRGSHFGKESKRNPQQTDKESRSSVLNDANSGDDAHFNYVENGEYSGNRNSVDDDLPIRGRRGSAHSRAASEDGHLNSNRASDGFARHGSSIHSRGTLNPAVERGQPGANTARSRTFDGDLEVNGRAPLQERRISSSQQQQQQQTYYTTDRSSTTLHDASEITKFSRTATVLTSQTVISTTSPSRNVGGRGHNGDLLRVDNYDNDNDNDVYEQESSNIYSSSVGDNKSRRRGFSRGAGASEGVVRQRSPSVPTPPPSARGGREDASAVGGSYYREDPARTSAQSASQARAPSNFSHSNNTLATVSVAPTFVNAYEHEKIKSGLAVSQRETQDLKETVRKLQEEIADREEAKREDTKQFKNQLAAAQHEHQNKLFEEINSIKSKAEVEKKKANDELQTALIKLSEALAEVKELKKQNQLLSDKVNFLQNSAVHHNRTNATTAAAMTVGLNNAVSYDTGTNGPHGDGRANSSPVNRRQFDRSSSPHNPSQTLSSQTQAAASAYMRSQSQQPNAGSHHGTHVSGNDTTNTVLAPHSYSNSPEKFKSQRNKPYTAPPSSTIEKEPWPPLTTAQEQQRKLAMYHAQNQPRHQQNSSFGGNNNSSHGNGGGVNPNPSASGQQRAQSASPYSSNRQRIGDDRDEDVHAPTMMGSRFGIGRPETASAAFTYDKNSIGDSTPRNGFSSSAAGRLSGNLTPTRTGRARVIHGAGDGITAQPRGSYDEYNAGPVATTVPATSSARQEMMNYSSEQAPARSLLAPQTTNGADGSANSSYRAGGIPNILSNGGESHGKSLSAEDRIFTLNDIKALAEVLLASNRGNNNSHSNTANFGRNEMTTNSSFGEGNYTNNVIGTRDASKYKHLNDSGFEEGSSDHLNRGAADSAAPAANDLSISYHNNYHDKENNAPVNSNNNNNNNKESSQKTQTIATAAAPSPPAALQSKALHNLKLVTLLEEQLLQANLQRDEIKSKLAKYENMPRIRAVADKARRDALAAMLGELDTEVSDLRKELRQHSALIQ